MNDNITLPRAVVEQALKALENTSPLGFNMESDKNFYAAIATLRFALRQQQDHSEQHLDMVPAGWKLVPVDPTEQMIDAARSQSSFPDGVYRSMLDAAPQPLTTEQSSAVNQPEPAYLLRDLAADIGVGEMDLIVAIRAAGLGCYSVNMMPPAEVCVAMCQRFSAVDQDPVAWIENVEGGIGYNPYHEAARKLPDGVRFDLYTHPQPKREPLSLAQIAEVFGWKPGYLPTPEQVHDARAIEAAHNIVGEA